MFNKIKTMCLSAKLVILPYVKKVKSGFGEYRMVDEDNAIKAMLKFSKEENEYLLKALEVCYASLCTYGAHPIIQQQVEKALLKATE